MSEIKGQLLGVLLVVTIFGAIGYSLYSAFKNASTKVTDSITTFDPTVDPNQKLNAVAAVDGFELLKY